MARCTFCGERDESRLILNTRVLNGRVETIDMCLRCYWREKFTAEGEDGNALQERKIEERVFAEPAPSASGIQ